MLDELNTGNGDIHSLVASLMFDELNGVPLKDIKSKFKHLRQEAKGYEFLIAYGGDFNTMMSNFGLQKEDAINKYNKYMNGLSGVKTYQNYRRKDLKLGISNVVFIHFLSNPNSEKVDNSTDSEIPVG